METTLKKIKDLIREDKDLPKEADEMFTKDLKLMGARWIFEELSLRKFIVSDSNMIVKMKHVLEVAEREGVKLQSCICETWTHQLFPCRHYARYCDQVDVTGASSVQTSFEPGSSESTEFQLLSGSESWTEMFPYLESYPEGSENFKRFTNKLRDKEDGFKKKTAGSSKRKGSHRTEVGAYRHGLSERGNIIE
eukprot:snap_masked-scaffold_8-processed-gene-4.30-mRNA-1 protein AED:1.00 eAED:1.00 QI:0/0/0/0/1/1/2/0/192